ncbi:hypothetical protein Nepgr_026560 [Nepenthes gracilis]|uniref:Uncharacterized protein n=1 Tax=Nepenthes gracilis TaxID=150966 RepID=A0AAD3Y0H6_NEPGR|nr:hypothetical protein Nepgr_026560 [Nepenthes gracilis]
MEDKNPKVLKATGGVPEVPEHAEKVKTPTTWADVSNSEKGSADGRSTPLKMMTFLIYGSQIRNCKGSTDHEHHDIEYKSKTAMTLFSISSKSNATIITSSRNWHSFH